MLIAKRRVQLAGTKRKTSPDGDMLSASTEFTEKDSADEEDVQSSEYCLRFILCSSVRNNYYLNRIVLLWNNLPCKLK